MISQPDSILTEVDEEIERVRAVRHRISERFEHDPYRLVAYYIEQQREHRDRLVPAPEADEPRLTPGN
jgi:hypothetical protein